MNWFDRIEDRLDGKGKEALSVLLNGNSKSGEVIYLERPQPNYLHWVIGGVVLLLLLRRK